MYRWRSLTVPKNVESDKPGIVGQIQPGAGLQYHRLLKHVQDFGGRFPIGEPHGPSLEDGDCRSTSQARRRGQERWIEDERPSPHNGVSQANGVQV